MRDERFKFRVWDNLISRYWEEGTVQLGDDGQAFVLGMPDRTPEYLNDIIIEQCTENPATAAPEMYAELQYLLDAMESGLFPQAAPGVDYPAVMEKKWELRKLLKKARGEE